jgi:hypothetical protein
MLTPFYDENSGDYGYKNEQGQIVIAPVYDEAEEFKHDVAIVRSGDHYGLIDESGKTILPVEFDTLYVYNYGWVQATKNKTEYLYNSQGEQLLQLPDLVWWYVPQEGIIRSKKQTGWGALNMKAEIVIPFKYASLGPCINGWLSYYENDKWGWLDKQGNIAVPAQHLEVGVWSDKLWWSRNKNGYTLYDYSGNVIYDEGWTKILEPANGMAAVKTVNGWKFIDDQFNTVLQLPPVYEWVEHFDAGLAAVKQNGVWGFIDSSGAEVIKPAYKNVSRFREGLAAVQIGEYWGFINLSGELVIPAQYRGAASFKDGKAWVRDTWCEWYIDKEGNDVGERKYWD